MEENGDMAQEQSNKVHPQTGSLLFQRLPQEIRDHIYIQLFSSTRFTSGYSMDIHPVRFRPAPNGLALLRACRRAKLEIGDSWLSRALFSFEDVGTMLDKLTALALDTLSKIRHMRVRGDPLLLSFYDGSALYSLAFLLKLLPGLQLDRLTVLGCPGNQTNYEALGGLVKDGNGWKTLRYLSHSSAMLGFPSEHDNPSRNWAETHVYWRKPQPTDWQSVMEGRDGAASKPLVTVYRAQEPGVYGSILDPSRRVKFEQKPREGDDLRPDAFAADPELMSGDEEKKELLVVVERGSGVDYEEKKGSPFIQGDLRRGLPGRTWTEIRTLCEDIVPHGQRYSTYYGRYHEWSSRGKWWWSGGQDSAVEENPTELDVYKDVDEYAWTQWHHMDNDE